jgi:hypothetical protein
MALAGSCFFASSALAQETESIRMTVQVLENTENRLKVQLPDGTTTWVYPQDEHALSAQPGERLEADFIPMADVYQVNETIRITTGQ